ncbi:2-dehydropantoate 2-reductase [Lentithecium fluviatile CBS 122367]|uniref:2-dehydropantoate 2-reductase n=1 Tax=Lentithecium fluviatile CBS 122367 TaxID=1168545 RepID=A0A6G1IDT8_9PLEO|nr:2-dehydropantoate 2-reductase [Lentithecium fluviatile CBS 122367]
MKTVSNSPRILLFGVGSVGAVYLYLLSRITTPTAVCRSNYSIVSTQGFTIHSSIFGQNLNVKPNVVRSCEEAASQQLEPFDYVIVCSKAIPNTIPELIKPAVTVGHTAIVLLQNGIGIEEEYVQAFPQNPVVSVAVYCKTTQRPVGVVTHDEVERLQVGSYPSDASDAHAEAFTKMMQAAGANAVFYTDVQQPRWYKLLANASWNPICALTLCTDVDFLTSSFFATGLIRDIMLEVRDIAKAYGYEISSADVEMQLERAKARIIRGNPVEPSMLQDVKEGRKMEVEAISGNAVRMGKEKGIECGKLEMLYALIKALDSQMGREKLGL